MPDDEISLSKSLILGVKTCDVLLCCATVVVLLIVLHSLFFLFYVIGELHGLLHRE